MNPPHLYTLWLPMVSFVDLTKKVENSIKSKKSIKRCKKYTIPKKTKQFSIECFIYKGEYRVLIDSLGFIYIDTQSDDIEDVLKFLIEDILNHRTTELIYKTFLNRHISILDKEQNTTMLDFLKKIYKDFRAEHIDDVIIELIDYKLNIENQDKDGIDKIKLTLQDNYLVHPLYNIINRNFKKLLEKSIFFTHGLKYDGDEVYELSIFRNEKIKHLTDKLNLMVNKNSQIDNNGKEILENILKKAIQDTIEEETLLEFLKQSKIKYITRIYQKISRINKSLNKLNHDIWAIEDNLESKDVNTEEDIEIFVQNILQVIPKFKVIDSKIKNAYYIKVGNMTTSTKILEGEVIESTLFYQKWKSAIDYFENMAKEIKSVLVIYHQNKTIRELENITYYENFQADIDDIKSIQSDNYDFSTQTKSYIETVAIAIGAIALYGDAPIFKIDYILSAEEIKDLNILENMLLNLLGITINVSIYFFILSLIAFPIIKITFPKIKRLFLKMKSCILNEGKTSIYKFDKSDFDKHEHRSTKPLYTCSDKDTKEISTVSYSDIDSAYDLMKNLKSKSIKKFVKPNGEFFVYNIFPSILQEPYAQEDMVVRENYRITRTDKVITKLLYRYKITNLSLNRLIYEIENNDKRFIEYFKEISKNATDGEDKLENILKSLKEMPKIKSDVELTIYVVYSFTLKFKDVQKHHKYTYNIIKDQYRVHYHINQIPYLNKEDIEKYQKDIAKLIYIYFLARLKAFY